MILPTKIALSVTCACTNVGVAFHLIDAHTLRELAEVRATCGAESEAEAFGAELVLRWNQAPGLRQMRDRLLLLAFVLAVASFGLGLALAQAVTS